MKILFLHLSDVHFESISDINKLEVDKVIKALNVISKFDELVIVFSGDITASGEMNQYKVAHRFLGELVNAIKNIFFSKSKKWINIFVVPGNHDLNFDENSRTFQDITKAYKEDKISTILEGDLQSLNNFYDFAKFNKCFINEHRLLCKNEVRFKNVTICLSLINSAPFSLKGSANEDKGIHYLPGDILSELNKSNECDLNIALMHHNVEWFNNDVSNKLKKIFSEKYNFIITGHEHDACNEVRSIGKYQNFRMLQGSSLLGDKRHERGFSAYLYDSGTHMIQGYSFIWTKDFYNHCEIFNESVDIKQKIFSNSLDYEFYNNNLYFDSAKVRKIEDFFVLPQLNCTKIGNKEEIIIENIDSIDDLLKVVLENKKIIISGQTKSGKTTLLKRLYCKIINENKGYVPLLLYSEELNNKNIDKLIRNAFEEQYTGQNSNYQRFEQLDQSKRIVLLDGIDRIKKKHRDILIQRFNSFFGTVIFTYEQDLDFDLKKQIITILEEEVIIRIEIMPFLYDKRKELIEKIYDNIIRNNNEEYSEEINSINKMINNNVKFFRLDPEFITNFVIQYIEKFNFSSVHGNNVFSMVYENNIKKLLIETLDKGKLESIYMVLQELAFYMHFNRRTTIDEKEVLTIIEQYNKDFGQKIKLKDLLESSENAQIFMEYDIKYRFKDKNLLSYFCAQALNRKSFAENIDEELKYLLHNLCFGINSDIVLFMAFITNNSRIINIIIDNAKSYFVEEIEYSFDGDDFVFLNDSSFDVKDYAPTDEEKEEKSKVEVAYEKEMKSTELIQLVDEYNYSEEDLLDFQNQMLKALKYIELISKILPAFSYNMKIPQQDELVKLIYELPNKFLNKVFKEIQDDYNKFINEIYNNFHDIHKEKKLSDVHNASIKNEEYSNITDLFKKISVLLIISIFEYVSSSVSTQRTLDSLERFNYDASINYQVMNLMILEKVGALKNFKERSFALYDKSDNKLVKSIVKLTVRRYFLDNDVKLVGNGQALLDKFFNNNNISKQKIKGQLAKNRLLLKRI